MDTRPSPGLSALPPAGSGSGIGRRRSSGAGAGTGAGTARGRSGSAVTSASEQSPRASPRAAWDSFKGAKSGARPRSAQRPLLAAAVHAAPAGDGDAYETDLELASRATPHPAAEPASPDSSSPAELDFAMHPIHLFTISPRFVSPETERSYQAYRVSCAFPRVRRLMPPVFVMYTGFVVLSILSMTVFEPRYREENFLKRMLKVGLGNIPGWVGGGATMCLGLWFPSFFRRHMMFLLTFVGISTAGAMFLVTIDFPRPHVIYYPMMWATDLSCRGIFYFTPYASLATSLLMVTLVWTLYPALGIVNSFSEYGGLVIFIAIITPFTVMNSREEEVRKRNEFAQISRDALEKERLRLRIESLHAMLRRLQQERGGGADLDGPLVKAVDALARIRSDPRLAGAAEWVPPALDEAVSLLISSGSVNAPDFQRQIAEGRLRLDGDISRWLFSEIVPQQKARPKSSLAIGAARNDPPTEGEGEGEEERPRQPRESPSLRQRRAVVVPLDLVDVGAQRAAAALSAWSDFSVDVAEVDRALHGCSLLAVTMTAVKALGLHHGVAVDLERLERFLGAIQGGYLENPYHNRSHAADVARSMAHLLAAGGVGAHLTDLEKLAALVACAVHDYEHSGVNNNFLTATGAPLAILYNDRSPLESHHVAASWRVLQQPECNFLRRLPRHAARDFRRAVIDAVLATDMAQHFEVLGSFRKRSAAIASAGVLRHGSARSSVPESAPSWKGGSARHLSAPSAGSSADPLGPQAPSRRASLAAGPDTAPKAWVLSEKAEATSRSRRVSLGGESGRPPSLAAPAPPALPEQDDRRLILSMAVKVCDVGHSFKPLSLHTAWSRAIQSEFFAQGDRERELGLEISPFMDRESANFERSQLGFMDFIGAPLVETLAAVYPGLAPLTAAARENRAHWEAAAKAAE